MILWNWLSVKVYGLIERILKNFEIKNCEILVKDLFEECHTILGYIIISESFGFDKVLFKILKLDLFANFYNFLGHTIVL